MFCQRSIYYIGCSHLCVTHPKPLLYIVDGASKGIKVNEVIMTKQPKDETCLSNVLSKSWLIT